MGDTKGRTGLDRTGALAIVVATLALVLVIPLPSGSWWLDPSYLGIAGYLLTLVALVGVRLRRGRGTAAERGLWTLFLAAMPLVYVANVLRFGVTVPALAVELAGLALFAVIAFAVARRRPTWLALGIAAHGVWDLAHLGSDTTTPGWYSLACAIVDFAVALYVFAQVRPGKTHR